MSTLKRMTAEDYILRSHLYDRLLPQLNCAERDDNALYVEHHSENKHCTYVMFSHVHNEPFLFRSGLRIELGIESLFSILLHWRRGPSSWPRPTVEPTQEAATTAHHIYKIDKDGRFHRCTVPRIHANDERSQSTSSSR